MRLQLAIAISALGILTGSAAVNAQDQPIDIHHSKLTLRVFKSGVFSGFAHDHEIEAPIADGKIDSSAKPGVELRVESRQMKVLDPGSSADERAKIEHTMQGATVLDVERFPQISYRSSSVTAKGENHWQVRGTLSLHGKEGPVVVEVSLQDGHYRGSATLKQTTFGIEPIRIAGGTVKVKDEVKVEFDIV